MAVLNVAVLISGRGSNMQALVRAAQAPGFPAKIVCVLANLPDAAGLAWARENGIPTEIVDHRPFGKDREAFEKAMDEKIVAHGAQLVCLAGFMRLISPWFVEKWRDRLVNIHPSLLPSFPGLHVHEQALAAGVKFSGCTVHFVRPGTDDGPIIVQAAVPVLQGDDPDGLAARILEMEHKIYPAALRWIAEGRVNVHNERCFIAGAIAPESAMNPGV